MSLLKRESVPIVIVIVGAFLMLFVIIFTIKGSYDTEISDKKKEITSLRYEIVNTSYLLNQKTSELIEANSFLAQVNKQYTVLKGVTENQRKKIDLKDTTIRNIYSNDPQVKSIVSDLQSNSFRSLPYRHLNYETSINDLYLLYRLYLSPKYSPIYYEDYVYALYIAGVNKSILATFYHNIYELDNSTIHTCISLQARPDLDNSRLLTDIASFLSVDDSLSNRYNLGFYTINNRLNCDYFLYVAYNLKKNIEMQRELNRNNLNAIFDFF
jgi:hypothetical protein